MTGVAGIASSPASRENGCGVNWRGVCILCVLGTLTGVHTSVSHKGEGRGGSAAPPPPPPPPRALALSLWCAL